MRAPATSRHRRPRYPHGLRARRPVRGCLVGRWCRSGRRSVLVLPDCGGHRRRRCGGRSWRCGRRDARGRSGWRCGGRSRHQRLVAAVAVLAAQRVLEATHALAERTPDLRQSLGAKDQQDDDEQQKDMKRILKTHTRTIAQHGRCEAHLSRVPGLPARGTTARDTWLDARPAGDRRAARAAARRSAGRARSCSTSTARSRRSSATPPTPACPEQTRTRLIELAKRYGTVACVSGRSAAVARQMVAIGSIAYIGNHGSELLRARALEAIRRSRRSPRWAARVRAFADRADTPALQQLRRPARGQGRDRRLPLARRPGRGRRAGRGRRRSSWRRTTPAWRPTAAARCSRSARRCRSTRAAGSARCSRSDPPAAALYVGDDSTDVDAFAGLRDVVGEGAVCVGVRSEETPAGARGGGGRDGRWSAAAFASCSTCCCADGPLMPFADFVRTTVLLCAAAATTLAAVTLISARSPASRARRRSRSAGGRWRA